MNIRKLTYKLPYFYRHLQKGSEFTIWFVNIDNVRIARNS